jgi:DNA-binding Xre family transcriptional regulator
MRIHAYDKEYVELAQKVMGDMFDFAVNTCNIEPDDFFYLWASSSIMHQFEIGNPTYVAGKTGCEVVREVLFEHHMKDPEVEDAMYLDKSPEYWAGWALAYYQWYSAKSFIRIHDAVSMEDLCLMYSPLHEADIMKFVDIMDFRIQKHYPDTNLKRIRKASGFTQKELSELSGVSLRQIQLFEQRQRDINKVQAISLFALGKVLGCEMEDLLEI